MGWSVECVPSPLKNGSGEAVPPPQKFLKFFLVQCVQKIFVFRPKGGGHRPVPPPKYATAPRSFSIRHSAACHSAIRSDRVVVARARKSDTGGPGQSCWKRSALNRGGGYHFPLSALGILNDYALYKSTHSLTLTHPPSLSFPPPSILPLSSPLEVGPQSS